MKINLVKSISDTSDNIPDHNNIAIDQIDEIANTICQSIIIENVLQYLSLEQLEIVLSKMRHGGTITINCIDMLEIAQALYWGKINLDQLSSLVSGSVRYHSIIETKNFLEQRGYIIEQANINIESFSFLIKAKRSSKKHQNLFLCHQRFVWVVCLLIMIKITYK